MLVIKNPPGNAGDIKDTGSIPGPEDPLEEGLATLHYSCLENRMDRGAMDTGSYDGPQSHKESDTAEAT